MTLYWDIFRDYVLNHVTSELLLDYIPQLQFGSAIRAFTCLLEHGDMTATELSEQLSISPATVDNIMIDAVMFGVVQKSNNIIHLIPDSKEELALQLQTLFKKHVIYEKDLQSIAKDTNFKTLEKTSIHHIGVEEFFNKLYKEYVKKEDFENDLFFSTYMCNSVVDYILNCILDNTVRSYTLQICG